MKIDHHRGPVVCVEISSTSDVLVSGSTDGTICLWSLETYELLNLLQFNSPVINFCLSPDSVSESRHHCRAKLFTFLLNSAPLDLPPRPLRRQRFIFANARNRNRASSTKRAQIQGKHKRYYLLKLFRHAQCLSFLLGFCG